MKNFDLSFLIFHFNVFDDFVFDFSVHRFWIFNWTYFFWRYISHHKMFFCVDVFKNCKFKIDFSIYFSLIFFHFDICTNRKIQCIQIFYIHSMLFFMIMNHWFQNKSIKFCFYVKILIYCKFKIIFLSHRSLTQHQNQIVINNSINKFEKVSTNITLRCGYQNNHFSR